jgi:hypothetical protein
VEMDSEEPVDSRGREASVNNPVRVREFLARVIEERPNHNGWKAHISEAGTHAGYDNSPSSTFRLSSSDKFTPESLGPVRLEPARSPSS